MGHFGFYWPNLASFCPILRLFLAKNEINAGI